ncbi:uncharacterized protein LOC143033965 isoform X2 [Oratosquilla oratoria]|uniref:uncharacterized protein LOC143033965 isoform X2 n=1 Tax=Oratosquilla oratoria TaxID=337810 RepID=UPI003F76BFE0
MGADQQFCLRWNNFHTNITSAFESLRDDEDFVDITLACEGRQIKAHKMVLSACSPYFRSLLKEAEGYNESSSPPPPRDPPDPGSPRPEESGGPTDTHLSDSSPPAKRQRRRSGTSVHSAEDTNETVLSEARDSVKNEPQDYTEEEDMLGHSVEPDIKADATEDGDDRSSSFGPSESVTISRSQAAMQQLQESFGSFLPGMGQSPGFLPHGASDMPRPPPFPLEGVQGLPPGISALPGPSMSQGASQDASQGLSEDANVCRFCGKVCSNRWNLKKHERDMHLNRGLKYMCELCNKHYGSLNSLQVHRSTTHPTGRPRRKSSSSSTTPNTPSSNTFNKQLFSTQGVFSPATSSGGVGGEGGIGGGGGGGPQLVGMGSLSPHSLPPSLGLQHSPVSSGCNDAITTVSHTGSPKPSPPIASASHLPPGGGHCKPTGLSNEGPLVVSPDSHLPGVPPPEYMDRKPLTFPFAKFPCPSFERPHSLGQGLKDLDSDIQIIHNSYESNRPYLPLSSMAQENPRPPPPPPPPLAPPLPPHSQSGGAAALDPLVNFNRDFGSHLNALLGATGGAPNPPY